MTDHSGIHYRLIDGGKRGQMMSDYKIKTPITGYYITLNTGEFRCTLYIDGTLIIYAGSKWDFGTGAINTPAMVRASATHDAFCHLTDRGLIPWKERFAADKFFWKDLGDGGATISRLWRVPIVMLYSQTIARWRRTK